MKTSNEKTVRPDAAGGRSEPAKGLASSTYSTGMAYDVLAQHTIHAGLPAFAGGFEIGKDFLAITHRYELLCAPGLGATAQRPQWNHGLELLGRERLASGSDLAAAVIALSSLEVGMAIEGRLDTLDIVFHLATIGAAQTDDPSHLTTIHKGHVVEDSSFW